MQRSATRILATHTGSLPRPPEILRKLSDDGAVTIDDVTAAASREIVARQLTSGLDIVNDGEITKPSYVTYVPQRYSGFGGTADRMQMKDRAEFPDEVEGSRANKIDRPACIGPVALSDPEAVQRDIAELTSALDRRDYTEAFMTAVSPGTITMFMTNRHYASHEDYVAALADAMSSEYKAIVDAGLILQIDCPDLGMVGHLGLPDGTLDEQVKRVELHIEALNSALAGLPPERMRMHVCWGNYQGPHHYDIEFAHLVRTALKARPQGLLVEAANPRHEHEWQVFKDVALPDDKIIIPGVVDSTSSFIEHPDLVAQRIIRYAELVGRENVIAGADCGFGTFAGLDTVNAELAWRKLGMIAEGARRATDILWR